MNPWHADLVHYQNFAMAHGAGRLREYQEFGVEAWRFVANGESCPICEPVIGRVFALTDRRFFPPLHFFCDCEEEVVFEEELQPGEVQDSSRVDNPAFVRQQARPSGFKWDPASYGNLEPVRLGRWPAELQGPIRALGGRLGWEFVS